MAFQKNYVKYISLVIVVTVLILYFKKPIVIKIKSDTKYILYWSPFWNRWDYYIGTGYKPFENCTYKNCIATTDRQLVPLEKYDALIFHATYNKQKYGIPWIRSPHQKYIFMNVEAPVYICPNLKQYESYFNLTMSYRFDSDIIRRHGYFVKEKTNYIMPSIEWIKNKTGIAAWFVSNCNTKSHREILVREIQKFITVDVYGHCGPLKCDHKPTNQKLSSAECYTMVEEKYKFYFSFENSFCKDYATEKLYNLLLKNIVPVVYGFGDYKVMAPPNSVINVNDFDNVTALVDYLLHLSENVEEYLKYFEWKKYYKIVTSLQMNACQLCQKLNEPEVSVYDELEKWWWGENKSICRTDKMLPKIVSSLL